MWLFCKGIPPEDCMTHIKKMFQALVISKCLILHTPSSTTSLTKPGSLVLVLHIHFWDCLVLTPYLRILSEREPYIKSMPKKHGHLDITGISDRVKLTQNHFYMLRGVQATHRIINSHRLRSMFDSNHLAMFNIYLFSLPVICLLFHWPFT